MWFIRNFAATTVVAVAAARGVAYLGGFRISVTPQQAVADGLILAGLALYLGKEPFKRRGKR